MSTAGVRYSTLRGFFLDQGSNPFPDLAAEQVFPTQWKASAGGYDDKRILLKAIEQFSKPAIGAIMIMVVDDGVPYAELIYGLTKYPMTPSDPSSEFADRCFDVLDELEDSDEATLVKITADYFTVTPSINVYEKEYHQQAITADVNRDVHAAIKDNASQRETIRVRRAMFLPFVVAFFSRRKEVISGKDGQDSLRIPKQQGSGRQVRVGLGFFKSFINPIRNCGT